MVRLCLPVLFLDLFFTVMYSPVHSELSEVVEEGNARFYVCKKKMLRDKFCWAARLLSGEYCWVGSCPRTEDWMKAVEDLTSYILGKNCQYEHPRNITDVVKDHIIDALSGICLKVKNGKMKPTMSALMIYGKPQTPVCELHVPSDHSRPVRMTCRTEKVYPEAGCYFEHSLDNITFSTVSGEVSYDHRKKKGKPEYYESRCTLTIAKDFLPDGQNYLRVLMHPMLPSDAIAPNVSSMSYSLQTDQDNKTRGSLVIIVGLSVGLVLVIVVAIVLAVLVIRQRMKSRRTMVPAIYDRVSLNQPCEQSVYQVPQVNYYLTILPPSDDDKEVKPGHTNSKRNITPYSSVKDHDHEVSVSGKQDVTPYSSVRDHDHEMRAGHIHEKQDRTLYSSVRDHNHEVRAGHINKKQDVTPYSSVRGHDHKVKAGHINKKQDLTPYSSVRDSAKNSITKK